MFNLPKSTEVKNVLAKNYFDDYTNTRQKKIFTDKILRITLQNTISVDSVNLSGKEIVEIHIIEIELKEQLNLKTILNIMNRAIPYAVIFIIRFKDLIYISTSPKHINPISPTNAVIDYTFETDWMEKTALKLKIDLKSNLDWIYQKFCEQFLVTEISGKDLPEIVRNQKKLDTGTRELEKLRNEISKCKQFNKKVELNLKLRQLENKSL